MDGKLIIPLLIVLSVSVLSQLFVVNAGLDAFNTVFQQTGGSTSLPVVGSVALPIAGFTVGFTMMGGVVTLILASVVLVLVGALKLSAGFKPFGIGVDAGFDLGGVGAQQLIVLVVFYGLWVLMSLFASPLLMAIPFFGIPIYFLLTLVYTLGVFEHMRVGG